MKTIARIICAGFISLMLTSCLDILHIVRLNENGDIRVTYRISIANPEGNNGSAELQNEIPSDAMAALFRSGGIRDFSADTVSTAYASSIMMQFSCPRDFTADIPLPLAPIWTGDALELYPMNFPESGSGESPQDISSDEMAKSMLMSINYTLLLSHEVFPDLSRLTTADKDGKEEECGFIDLGDYYLIDIPLGTLMEDPETRLIFRKGGGKPGVRKTPKPEVGEKERTRENSRDRDTTRGGW